LKTIKLEAPYAAVTLTATSGPYAVKFGAGQSADTVAEIMMTTTFTASGAGVKAVDGSISAPLNTRIVGRLTASFSTKMINSVYGVDGRYEVGQPRLNPLMKLALQTGGTPQLTDKRTASVFEYEAVLVTGTDTVSSKPYFLVPLKVSYTEDGKEVVVSDSELSFTGAPAFTVKAE
jgi:hypothetical protein